MTKVIFIPLVFIWIGVKPISAQNVNIPDVSFLQTLINLGLDTDNDGKIQVAEAAAVTRLTISSAGITNLTGIEAFINLDSLDCSSNQLTALDLSQNTKLKLLYCSINKLTSLDLSKNIALNNLGCSNNKLTSLTISKNSRLITLDCGFNKLTNLDLSADSSLEVLECYSNQLDSLNLYSNTKLTALYCGNNKLISLDLSKNIDLRILDCQFCRLTNINLSKNIALTDLACYSNQLSNLDITNNIRLAHLDCGLNLYTYLNLSKNDSLSSADCSQNPELRYICVKDTNLVKSNVNFFKDNNVQWTQSCNQTTGMDKSPIVNMIQLNPNPSKESFNLLLQQPANIRILNSTGVEMEHFRNVQNLKFGVSYPPGFYFVNIVFTSNHTSQVIKLIKE